MHRIRALGAYHVIDRCERDVVADARRWTGQRGVDVIIDPMGTTLAASLAALTCKGRLVVVGNAGGGKLAADLWSPMQFEPIAARRLHRPSGWKAGGTGDR
jgi:NADPH:quinone reductase-like Zn-dependent oxidoreductase